MLKREKRKPRFVSSKPSEKHSRRRQPTQSIPSRAQEGREPRKGHDIWDLSVSSERSISSSEEEGLIAPD
jgi:hypothetical protein